MGNFQVTSVEDGKKYWISRSMATRSEVIVHDGEYHYILINKRGIGAPDFQGCWNIPCGYLEYDVTCKENATKELLEENKVYIHPDMWNLVMIEDSPKRNKQNVTVVMQVNISMEMFKVACKCGSEMNCDGGEVDEVDSVKLLLLNEDNINSIEWAFNHKNRAMEILNLFKYGN